MLESSSSGLGSSHGCGLCVVFLSNTLYAHTGTGVGYGVEGWATILFGRRSAPVASWRYPSTLVPDKPLDSDRTQPFLLPLGTTHVQRELNLSEKWKITQTFTTKYSLPSGSFAVG